jgi:hypothetical protein
MGPYRRPVVWPVVFIRWLVAITERAHLVRRGVGEPGQGSSIDVRGIGRIAAFFASPSCLDRTADRAAGLLDGGACRDHGGRSVGCSVGRSNGEPGAFDRSVGDAVRRADALGRAGADAGPDA